MSNNTSSVTYFDQVSAVGGRILAALGNSPSVSNADQYLSLLADTYATLAQIHEGVIDVTIEVSLARTKVEADQALERVQQMGIKESLKAQEMCDRLQALGQQLRQLPYSAIGLSDGEEMTWNELCQNLEQREGGTARLYDVKPYDLRNLPYTEGDLDTLKAKADEIANVLVAQKAQFDRLAKLASATRTRRP